MTTTKTISATLIPRFYSPRKRREILAQMRESALTGLIARINAPSPTVAEVKAQRLAEIADELQELRSRGAFVIVSAEEVFDAEQNSCGIDLSTGKRLQRGGDKPRAYQLLAPTFYNLIHFDGFLPDVPVELQDDPADWAWAAD